MQEESERISTDRLYRFRNSKKETLVERITPTQNVYTDTALTFGDFVIFNVIHKDFVCVAGQIISFERVREKKEEQNHQNDDEQDDIQDEEKSTKKGRNYPYNFCILSMKEKVRVKVSPCVSISRRGDKKAFHEIEFFNVKSYVATIQKCNFNLDITETIPRSLMNEIKNVMRNSTALKITRQ
jgi:hypothetical protein